MRSLVKITAILTVTMAVAACGGGGMHGENQPPAPALETLVTTGLPGLDGHITEVPAFSGNLSVNVAQPSFPLLAVGETDGGGIHSIFKGFVSFDLSAVPAGAVIESATLNVHLLSAGGEVLGPLFGGAVMEHVTLDGALDEADYDAPSLTGQYVGGNDSPTFLIQDEAPGYKSADITNEVRADVTAGRNVTSLRLRMRVLGSDADGAADVLRLGAFEADDVSNERRPYLLIRYMLPE